MQPALDVMDLARSTGLSVDTVRYYRKIGLLAPPQRRGRKAFYGQSHLDRLGRIREMADRGFSLKAIGAILDGEEAPGGADEILRAALEHEGDERIYTSGEFAARVGIPHPIVRSIERAGLAPTQLGDDGEPVYSEGDVHAAEGAMRLMNHGLPLTDLLSLAIEHDRAVRNTIDRAIDLFDDNVRKRADGRELPAGEVARAFEDLLPAVTGLVAHHFQRRLVNRALERLAQSGQRRHLKQALRATRRSRWRIPWR